MGIDGVVRRYWLVPSVAILAALLAFASSYVVSPSYEASTRLLVRGRNTSFLSNTGDDLNGQPAVIDANLAKAIGETQSALASSRAVAEMVVEDLDLHEPRPPEPGRVAQVRRIVQNGVSRLRGYLTHGYYEKPEPYEAALGMVQEGLRAVPLKDSYVIELRASAGDKRLAAAIADSAADALVTLNAERTQSEAEHYRDFLKSQLDRAAADEVAAAEAVRQYKEEHGISDVSLEIQLSAEGTDGLRRELTSVTVDMESARAELGALESELAATEDRSSTRTRIETGRSATEIENTSSNQVYEELLGARQRLSATVAGLRARQSAIEAALLGVEASGPLTAQEAALQELELRRSVANDTFLGLSEAYQEAVVTSETDKVELTRVDVAAVPNYPVKPVRYLYLFLGAIFGLLIGGALVVWRERNGPEPDTEHEPDETVIDLSDPMARTEPLPVAVMANGSGAGTTASPGAAPPSDRPG